VLTGRSEILSAHWSPAGDAIYYFARVNQTVSLYKVEIGETGEPTTGPAALITGLETDEGFGMSADGRRLVYARAPYYSNLWLVDLLGRRHGEPPRLTELTDGTAVVERPRVSPDGSTIVFNRGDESRANLSTIPATGGATTQLTFFNAFSVDGAWSPDGREVAFASTEGGTRRVWIVQADGSAPRPVSAGDVSEAFDVTWGPGAHILYQQSGNRNFFIVDRQSRRERLLIEDSSVGWASAAEYSPDGKRIAFAWNRVPRPGIWVIDPDSGKETLVNDMPQAAALWPIGWSPEGRFIVTYTGRRAAYRGLTASFEETLTDVSIVRVPYPGGLPQTLVRLPFDEVGTIAMFPDGERFVVPVYSSRSDIWIVEGFDGAGVQQHAGRLPRQPRSQ
jgi:Tol biopolymer transport system component